jgi:hypothetical protein
VVPAAPLTRSLRGPLPYPVRDVAKAPPTPLER